MFNYIVYHVNADSWNSAASLPIAVFNDKDKAEDFAKKQPGYGFNKDWFVKAIPLNPEN